MTMDSGGERPNKADDQPSEDSESWYFNLPGGAWERQEEKNRELRERVHSNLETPAPRADPFAVPKKEEKRGFFGRGKKQEEPEEHTTAGGTFRLARGGSTAPEPRVESADDDGDWSSEPEIPLRRRALDEAPLPLPSTEWTDDGDAPGEDILSSMRKWSHSSPGDAPPAAHRELPLPPQSPPDELPDSPSATEPSAEPAPIRPAVVPPPSLPLTFRLNRPEREVEAEDDTPSRWKDTFSGGAEESGGLAAMREWAESAPVLPPRHELRDEPTEIPEEFLKPFDWENSDAAAPPPAEIPAEFLKPFDWEADAEVAEAGSTGSDAPLATIEPVVAATGRDEHPWEPEPAAEPEPDAFLDDLFPRRLESATALHGIDDPDEKPGGVFGRLFGRKKQHEAAERVPASSRAWDVDPEGPGDAQTPEAAGWLPAEAPAIPLFDAQTPEALEADAETVAEEQPWRWPEPAAPAVAEEAEPPFELAVPEEAEAEPEAEENPWRWPEPTAPAVAEEVAPAFELAVPEEVEAETGAEENPWRWPEPAGAAVAEEAAPAFELAVPEDLEAKTVAEENPWRWPEPAATRVDEDAEPAFELALPGEVEPETVAEENPWRWPEPAAPAATSASTADGGTSDSDGWDPEPFNTPVPLRPGYTLASNPVEPEPEPEPESEEDAEPADEFSFSFEREDAEEERFSAPSAWEAPIALAAPEPADDERPWWETGDDNVPAAAGDEDAPAAEVPLPPTLVPTLDEDPWDEVASIDSDVPAANAAEFAPESAEVVDSRWPEAVPTPLKEDLPSVTAPVTQAMGGAFDVPVSASWGMSAPAALSEAWGGFNEVPPVPGLTPPEVNTAEAELDLAASLESQMAIAEDERILRNRWEEAATTFETETDGSRAEGGDRYGDDEDDVVLRAFNAHAATEDPEPVPLDRNVQRAEDAAFGELLGDGAADIVAEAADEEPTRSFLNPAPWVALRRDTPENPFDAPWEPDEGEPLSYRAASTDLRSAASASGAGAPWGADFSFDDEAPVEAAAHTGHNRTKTVIREVVETVMLAILVFLCVRASFQNFKVDGSSMYPTLENGQFLIVNKLVYSEVDMEKLSNFIPLIDASSGEKRNVFHGPERGDIVVLQDPRKPEVDLIKRVIGLPGETLEIVDGKVYINDFRLEEPYIKTVWHDNKPKVVVPPGEYFVMGDNRDNSLDSRSQQVGFVPKDLIIGKTMVSYWPKSKFGLAPNEAGNISTKDGVPRLTTQRVDEALVGR